MSAQGISSIAVGLGSQIQRNADAEKMNIADGFYVNVQGATSIAVGTANIISAGTATYDGVASSVIGQANYTNNSNASLIYGAGNSVTNSYREVELTSKELGLLQEAVLKYQAAVANKKTDEMEAASDTIRSILAESVSKGSGGQVLAVGGSNTADYALSSQLIGVHNSVYGGSATGQQSEYVLIDGYNNTIGKQEVTDNDGTTAGAGVKNTTVIGSNNKVGGGANNNIIIGDNQTIAASKANNIILGSLASVSNTGIFSENSVVIGHNATLNSSGANDSNYSVVIGSGASVGGQIVTDPQDNHTPIDGNAVTSTEYSSNGSYNAVAIGSKAQAHGEGSSSIGAMSLSNGTSSTAVGNGSIAENTYSLAVGAAATARGLDTTAIGYAALASDTAAIAMGTTAKAKAHSAIAIGNNASATAVTSSAIGYSANASGKSSIAIGREVSAAGDKSTVIGYKASVTSYDDEGPENANGIAIGMEAHVAGDGNAIGKYTFADSTGLVMGYGYGTVTEGAASYFGSDEKTRKEAKLSAIATNSGVALGELTYSVNKSVAAGTNAQAVNSAVAVGENAMAYGGGIAIGQSASAYASENNSIVDSTDSIAIGAGSAAKAKYATALGPWAKSYAVDGVAIGRDAEVVSDATYGVAIGYNAKTNVSDGVALGYSSTVADDDAYKAGYVGYDPLTRTKSNNTDSTWVSSLAAVSVGNSGSTRQIKNVAAGYDDTDAVNVAQLKASQVYFQAGDNITISAKEAENGGTLYTITSTGPTVSSGDSVVSVTPSPSGSSGNTDTSDGSGNTESAAEIAAIGTDSVGNVTNSTITAETNFQGDSPNDVVTLGGTDNKLDTLQITGSDGNITVTKGTSESENTGVLELALSDNLNVTNIIASESITAETVNATDVTVKNKLTAETVKATTVEATTVNATDVNATTVNATTFVAGNTTVNNDGLTISGGPSVTNNGIDAGGMKITNVAAGTADTDAVNYAQLKEVQGGVAENSRQINKLDKNIKRVGAHAAALSALHPIEYDEDHLVSLSAGVGGYHGHTALAVGMFVRPTENLLFSFQGSIASGDDVMGALGVSYRFGDDDSKKYISKADMVTRVNALTTENKDLSAQLTSANMKLESDAAKLQKVTQENAELRAEIEKIKAALKLK